MTRIKDNRTLHDGRYLEERFDHPEEQAHRIVRFLGRPFRSKKPKLEVVKDEPELIRSAMTRKEPD